VVSASGSNRSTRLSRVSLAWNGTAVAPGMVCSRGSRSVCWPWPPGSGTTGKPA
jgi:hypothetical protein